MEPNLLEAVKLFSQAIKQGSLFTKSGNPQNFSGSRKPFIGSDPVPVNQGRTPIPPSFRPEPVSPGQLGLFDVRANTPSSFNPSLERTGPRLSVPSTRPLSTLPANYSSFPEAPAGEVGSFRVMPPRPSSFDPSLERTGPRLSAPGARPLSSFPVFPEAPAGEVGSFRVMPEGTRTPMGAAGPQRSLIGPERFRAPSLPPALTGGGPSPSIMDLLRTAAAVRGGGAAGLAALAERSTPEPNYRNLGYASEAEMRGRIGAQELLESGRYVPGSQQQSIPKREGYNMGNVRNAFDTKRNNSYRDIDNGPASRPLNERAPLPQNNPPGNTMVPASNPFTKFFVDDANRLSPTTRELATATGGVQTRDLGSLTSGLRAADLESLLNSVGSAQAMSDSPSFMAGNPLTGTPKLMLTGAREQAVNEQKQQYAKQDMGSSKLDTNKMQQEALLNVQAQREAGRALMPDILRGLGYTTNETAGLAEWARTHPELALAEYNRQIQRGSLASNLNVRSEFPSPAEIQPRDPVNYKPVGNVSDYMVNTPMGSNFSNNAIGNSHYAAEAYVTGSQTATDLADATQALVQPTLQTEDQYTSQAPERMQATAEVSNDMLRRAMELKMGRSGQPNLFYGN